MLGEMIGELTGKITCQRIIRCHSKDLKLERTLEMKGKILGMEVTFIATTKTWERPQGGMFSDGNGVLMTMKGEKVIMHGSGVSTAIKGPAASIRGVRYAQTTAPSFSRLNNVAIPFEIEIMADGTVHDKWWEWK
jgi:hypothetical protein